LINELRPGIYSADHAVAEGKNGIILTERGAIAIDVGTKPAEGQVMADFLIECNYKTDRVILTHGHYDHVMGGQAFRGAEVYAHAAVLDEINVGIPRYAENQSLPVDEMMASVLWPTVTFSDELYLDMGDKHIHVFPTPGHSPDHTSVYVEEDRVLFAADTVVTAIIPAIFYDSTVLQESLTKVKQMEIEVMVAGHGPVLFGSEAIHAWLDWEINYLQGVRDFVRDELERDPHAASKLIAQRVDFDTYVQGRLPADQHNMIQRHQNTVVKICDEERARLAAAVEVE